MALRIGGGKPPMPPAEEPPVQDLPTPEDLGAMPDQMAPETEPDGDEAPASGVVDQQTAGYLGPEYGPFMCSNCIHFAGQDARQCDIVKGDIDPEGCCNLFSSHREDEESPMPEQGEAAPEQEPEEEQASQEGY